MSGAEAIALVGILANVLQLVDFSCQAFARIKECKEDSSHLPKVFWSLQNQLPLISHALKITWKQVQSNELDETACAALHPVIVECETTISALKSILEKVAVSPTDPGWKKSFKALTSCFHDKEVATISTSLSQSLTVINQYHGAYTATTTGAILNKLTAAVTAIPEKSDAPDQIPVRHFMVPTIWSDDFSGRHEIMIQLEKILTESDKHCRLAVVGLGGVGKTRVMIEYAYRVRNSESHSVFWIHASSRSRINKACLEIAKSAMIPGWDDPKTNKLELVSEWLESPRSGKWILMVDNADDFDLLFGSGNVVKLLPKSSTGSILMTTRDARVGMEFAKKTTINLGALTLKESKRLLENRLGTNHSNTEELTELSEELCGIPLALVQASSFIMQNYLSIPEYLDLYRASDRDKVELLSEDFDDEIRDPETLNPVATTWSITFEHILKHDVLAAETLSTMSVLDAQAIPESLLYSGIQKIKFIKAIGTLQAFALVTARSDGPIWEGRQERLFDFHRMVRLAMRSWLLLHGELESYTARTLKTLAERFTDGQWETRGKWSTYLPHAAVLLASDQLAYLENLDIIPVSHDQKQGSVKHIPEGIVCPVCASNILSILATCHYTIGSPIISLEEAERAYRMRKQFLGDNHTDTLATLDLISKPAKDLYLFPRAVEACKLAIKGKLETLGPEDPSTLTSMATLGIAYRPMGLLKDAIEIGSYVLEARRKTLGDKHPDTFTSMAYVATALRASGDYAAAVKLESEKLEGWTKLRGPSHPETLEAMAGLAWALACQGHYERAEELNSKSLSLQLEIRGVKHWFSMWTMHSMAVILGMQGKYFEAEELCERNLLLRIQHMKASHPFCYASKLYLAWLYNETGRYKKAEAVEMEVLAFQKSLYKLDTHNDVLHTKAQLASTYTFMGRHQEAEPMKRQVLSSRIDLSGEIHPVTLRCKSSLGLTCMELEKMKEAQNLLSEAWTCQQTVLGPEHPETLTTMSRIAKMFQRQGRRQEAEQCYRDVVKMSIRSLGISHPRTEARLEDFNLFENTRRNSDTKATYQTIKTIKSTNINIQTLTIVDEREVNEDED